MSGSIVKEGWLSKKGEYIQTWRPRWFILKGDGTFRGYKAKPMEGDAEGPINVFEIQNSSIKPVDPPKGSPTKKDRFGFVIRFMQLTRVIERTFHTESKEERDDWVKVYLELQKQLNQSSPLSLVDRTRAMSFIDPKTPKPCDINIEHFEMLKVLGKGTFGKVLLAKMKSTGEIFAIKVLKKATVLEKGELVHTLTENSVLAKCTHPFLAALKYSFQSEHHLCFVMEYVNGGELFMHLRRSKAFGEARGKYYAAEIILALTYLHEQGVVYRDLKLENLLLDSQGHCKITDFGLSKEEMKFGSTTTTFCGTPEYLAPEVLEESEYGRQVDWWGLGIVMYEMITGKLPFNSPVQGDWDALFNAILTAPLKFPADVSGVPLSEECKDLLTKLIERDPTKRLGAGPGDGHDVMAHPFFKDIDFKKLLRKELPPPFVPVVKSETDVSNFDPYFTKEEPKLTPPDKATALDERDESFESFESVAKH
eukprot:m.319956 g.319956  ORF g.319956 m.319956 type:complete len:480 (+) comp23595_c0_seq1:78-1517(+)